MKNLISLFLLILVSVIFLSCGKDKKPEYTDDNTTPKTTNQQGDGEEKNSEQKSSINNEKTEDTVKKNSNIKSENYRNREFENEKPEAVISPLEAGDYNGRTVTVKGFVADFYRSEKVAYLNFVEKYPDNPFTAVIFASKFKDFPDVNKYKGKNVEVTGRVSIYNSKPQIILNSPKQIVIK